MKKGKTVAKWLAGPFLALIAFTSVAAHAGDAGSLAKAIIDANATGTETPRVSVLDPDIDLKGAYGVQQIVVDNLLDGGDAVAGYKAGLTGKLARWWFDIDAPVFGVIMRSGLRHSGDTIAVPKGRHMLLETEIAFVAGTRIDKPVEDVAALKPLIRAVAPVIEAPAGGFPESQTRQLTVTDIVANNVSAHVLIVGEEQPYAELDLAKLTAEMKRGGETVSKGTGADVMGDPWKSALWLVNVAVREGRVIEPGNYLSTGVIGERVESEAGRYTADFGELGRIEFTIE
jgi:2-keto-4-pentenoate hydratase